MYNDAINLNKNAPVLDIIEVILSVFVRLSLPFRRLHERTPYCVTAYTMPHSVMNKKPNTTTAAFC